MAKAQITKRQKKISRLLREKKQAHKYKLKTERSKKRTLPSYILKCLKISPLIIIFGIIVYFAWMSRASKEIILSASAILTGLISLVGQKNKIKIILATIAIATGFIMLWLSPNEETRTVSFYKAYIFDIKSKYPFRAPSDYSPPFVRQVSGRTSGFSSTGSLVQEAIKVNPSIINEKGNMNVIEKGENLYRKIFFRQVLETLFLAYSNNWEISVGQRTLLDQPKHFTMSWIDTSGPRPDSKCDYIGWEDFQNWVPGNYLLNINMVADKKFISDKMCVPPGSKITASPAAIMIKNSFVSIHLSIGSPSGIRGIGPLKRLLQYSYDEVSKYWTLIFKVKLFAKFNSLRDGHPEMLKYKEWVSSMFEILQREFDSNRHWELAKEECLLYRKVPKETIEQIIKEKELMQQHIIKDNNTNGSQ